jgi:hypothetical protein
VNREKEEIFRIVASDSFEGITAFHKYVKENDVGISPKGAMYETTDLEVYEGPKIDWNYVGLSSISEQMDKGFQEAITGLKIDENISTVNSELSSTKDKFETTDQKFGSIGGTLMNIDNKIKPWHDS